MMERRNLITRRGFLRFVGGSFLAGAGLAAYAVGLEPMALTRLRAMR